MGAIGVVAIAFASLPWVLSVTLAVAIFGILGLRGLRLPTLTNQGGMRYWVLWALWCLSLAVCQVAMAVVGTVYARIGPPAFAAPRPWAAQVVDALTFAHLGVSVVASMSVVLLIPEGFHWIGWMVIVVIGILAAIVSVGATMATTGIYL